MKKLFELRQQKTALKNDMRTLLNVADGEKRSLTDEEGKKFEELRAQADALEVEISRLEAVQEEERNLPGTSMTGKSVTNDELRTYILTGERRALSTAVGADGDLLRGTPKERYENYQTGIKNGFLSPNNARLLEGLPPREGGDEFSQAWKQEVKVSSGKGDAANE